MMGQTSAYGECDSHEQIGKPLLRPGAVAVVFVPRRPHLGVSPASISP
jgi:hypothetical protein